MTDMQTTEQNANPVNGMPPPGDSGGGTALEDREGKYLTFTLASEEYGIGILKIKEINGMITITPVPQTPEFVKGVMNLRGKVIPVVDLRLRFGMEAIDYTERTCIIVVEIAGDAGTVHQGRGDRGHAHVRDQAQHRLHPRHGQDGRRREDPFGYRSGAEC
jgi:hypothetical protein